MKAIKKRSPPKRASFHQLVVMNGVTRSLSPVDRSVAIGPGLVSLGQRRISLGL